MKKLILTVAFLLLISTFVNADFNFNKITDNISEFTLPNGLKFVLLEDHSVPIATFVTYVNVGSSDEQIGIYGISHFLEHMAFKGTKELGTNNYKAEQKAFQRMDDLFLKIQAEKNAITPDKAKLEAWEKEFKGLMKEVEKYVNVSELDKFLTLHGSQNLNAGTSTDSTVYFYSLPSNKVELWAYLESDRFVNGIFREFHKEKALSKKRDGSASKTTPSVNWWKKPWPWPLKTTLTVSTPSVP